jgi:hypothetical protein
VLNAVDVILSAEEGAEVEHGENWSVWLHTEIM